MGPEALAQVLRPLSGFVPPERRADLLVGLAEGDDAAVYKLSDSRALVFTADFFTPVVDDPYDFGAVAAANALSDVYATGGEPVMALNLAAFPPDLPTETVAAIVRGGAEKAAEAGCAVAGGHTIMDAEPKFGMAVVGFAQPDRLFRKTEARPGDVLVLTKPLGTGTITTAAKEGAAPADVLAAAVASMKTLNRAACDAFLAAGVACCTDVTGFGLAGHALELASKSGVGLEMAAAALPWLPGAVELAASGYLPGGARRNRSCYEASVRFAEGAFGDGPAGGPDGRGDPDGSRAEALRALFFGPETSGGLLAAVPPAAAEACVEGLRAAGVPAVAVGRVVAGAGILVTA